MLRTNTLHTRLLKSLESCDWPCIEGFVCTSPPGIGSTCRQIGSFSQHLRLSKCTLAQRDQFRRTVASVPAALLQKLVDQGDLAGNLPLRDFSFAHKLKAQTFRGKFRSIFRRKVCSLAKKTFVQSSLCRRATLSKCKEVVVLGRKCQPGHYEIPTCGPMIMN